MSTCTLRLFSQIHEDSFLCESISTIGVAECTYSTVFKYITLSISKNDLVGSFTLWNPVCCGYVTVTTGGNINNYSIKYATWNRGDSTITFHLLADQA